MLQFIKNHKVSILIVVIIFYLCTASRPIPAEMPKIEGLDKVVHFLMYFGLAMVLFFETPRNFAANNHSCKNSCIRGKQKHYFLTIGFPILYGGFIEIIQHYFFSPRTADIADFIANTVGVVFGYFAANQLLKYEKVRHQFKKLFKNIEH